MSLPCMVLEMGEYREAEHPLISLSLSLSPLIALSFLPSVLSFCIPLSPAIQSWRCSLENKRRRIMSEALQSAPQVDDEITPHAVLKLFPKPCLNWILISTMSPTPS